MKEDNIYIVETCCDCEEGRCIGVFDTLEGAKKHALENTLFGDSIEITTSKMNTFISPYGFNNKGILTYNVFLQKWE